MTAYYSSFTLAAVVMLAKRLTIPDSELPWGPFRLGRAGVPITVAAIAYSVVGAFFALWPPKVKPEVQDMNYCVIVFGAVMALSIVFWLAYGRTHYVSPKLEMLD